MEANFENWVETEKKWIAEYRKRTMHQLTHITAPLVIGVLVIFFAAMQLLGGASVADTIITAIGAAIMGFAIMMIPILVVRAGVSDKRMQKAIMRAVKELNLGEAEQYQLAREMMDAYGSPEKELAFESKAPASNNPLPVCVTVTKHFAYIKGDNPLVNIIRRSDVDHVEPFEEERQSTRYGAQTKTYYTYNVYAIKFIGRDEKEVGSFFFFSEQIRNSVLNMLSSK